MESGTFREILRAAMSEENVDRYRRVVEAFARRDLDAFLELFEPDVDFAPRSAELEGRSYRGHEGIGSRWEAMFRLFSEYTPEMQRRSRNSRSEVHVWTAAHFGGPQGKACGAQAMS